MDWELVKTIHVDVKVRILEYECANGDHVFEWTASNDSESDELFNTADEAEQDACSYFGG